MNTIRCYCLLLGLLCSAGAWASGDCQGAPLASMSGRYEAAIGEEFYTSEGDSLWSGFHSGERTPMLETDEGPAEAIEGLKKILFEEVRRIYPYYEPEGESPDTLHPYLDHIQNGASMWERYPDSDRYRALEEEFAKDFSQVWMVKIGMKDADEYPASTFPIFLLGQTACGEWVGLRTFSIET